MVSFEKWQIFLKNILVYFSFTMCVLVKRTPSVFLHIFSYLPDIDILFLYCCFFLSEKYTDYVYLHLFLLGLIIDTFSFLPLGMSGLSLLLTYKIMAFFTRVVFAKGSALFFVAHNFVFIMLYFMLTWFFLSLHRSSFVPIIPVFSLIMKNVLYFNAVKFLYMKSKK
jgi:hypothetical protein